MNGITRKPAFWIVFAVISALVGCVCLALFPGGAAADQSRRQDDARRRVGQARPRSQTAWISRRPARNARCCSRTTARRRTSSSSRRAASRRSPQMRRRHALFAVLVGGAAVQAGRDRRGARALSPGRHALRIHAQGAGDASPARRSMRRRRARSPRRVRATDWGDRLRALQAARAIAADSCPTGASTTASSTSASARQLGDGRYRLRLGVAGDRLVDLTHFVYIPEAFERRFQEMRFANNAIAEVAGISAGALYGIGGCVLGVLWLLRRRALLWRPALVAGAIVARPECACARSPTRRRRGSTSTPRSRPGCSGGSSWRWRC